MPGTPVEAPPPHPPQREETEAASVREGEAGRGLGGNAKICLDD